MSLQSINNRNAVYRSLEFLQPAERRVYEFLLTKPTGATRHEIAAAVGMPLSSVCGRIAKLEADGHVVSTAATRMTVWGKPATVVKVTQREQPIQLELFGD